MKFSVDILHESDENGDKICMWHHQADEGTAFCVFCSQSINCLQHGVAAVKRHATATRHIESTSCHRDASGMLQRPKTIQPTLRLISPGNILHADCVTKAETLFVLGMTLKGIPYSWADTATALFPKMFTD